MRLLLGLAACAALASGCGAILGLEEGERRDDADGASGSDATSDGTAETGDEASGDVMGSDVADTAVADVMDAADAGPDVIFADGDAGCPSGTTVCSAICESNTNPLYGCGNQNCTACVVPNATPTCLGASCAVGSCDPNYKDCDDAAANGCETDLRSPQHCGGCNIACDAGDSCQNGACMSGCAFPLCSGICYNQQTDPDHCGSCTGSCAFPPNASRGCTTGTCSYACAPGYANCNTSWTDGCEAFLGSVPNCGTCGNACNTPPGPNMLGACSGVTCSYTCAYPYAACPGSWMCTCDQTTSMCVGASCVPRDAGSDAPFDAPKDTNPPFDAPPDTNFQPPDSSVGTDAP
jgi:hypothetical protein